MKFIPDQSNDCDETHKHMHIDYYGGCQELPKCEQEVLDDFPRRMKDWLYTIMTLVTDILFTYS